jgi:hypothetical protein
MFFVRRGLTSKRGVSRQFWAESIFSQPPKSVSWLDVIASRPVCSPYMHVRHSTCFFLLRAYNGNCHDSALQSGYFAFRMASTSSFNVIPS